MYLPFSMKLETVFSRRSVELQHSSYNTNKMSSNVSILKLFPLAIIGPPKNICSSSLIRSSGENPDIIGTRSVGILSIYHNKNTHNYRNQFRYKNRSRKILSSFEKKILYIHTRNTGEITNMSRKHNTHLKHRESETNTQAVNSKHGSAFKLGYELGLAGKVRCLLLCTRYIRGTN